MRGTCVLCQSEERFLSVGVTEGSYLTSVLVCVFSKVEQGSFINFGGHLIFEMWVLTDIPLVKQKDVVIIISLCTYRNG